MSKTIFRLLSVLFVLSLVFVFPTQAHAQSAWTGVCVENVNLIKNGQPTGETVNVATIQGLQCVIGNILQVAITLIGLAGFVMMLVGSFTYLLSGGNSKGVENARNTITYTIVGLVVALSAVVILNLISAFTGVSIIKTFRIPSSNCNLPGGPTC